MRVIEFNESNAADFGLLMLGYVEGGNDLQRQAAQQGKKRSPSELREDSRILKKLKAVGDQHEVGSSLACPMCGRQPRPKPEDEWTLKSPSTRIVLEVSEWARLKACIDAMQWGMAFSDRGADILDLVDNASPVTSRPALAPAAVEPLASPEPAQATQ